MKDKLIEILNEICPDRVYTQGTLSTDYPADFITIWTNGTDFESFYDDKLCSAVWSFSVIYYSNDPDKVATVPHQISDALKAEGFIPQSKGMDIPSDEPSHTGWAMDFKIIEFLNKGEYQNGC